MTEDRCVCCGGYVPEGRMVCTACENNYTYKPVSTHVRKDPAAFLEDYLDIKMLPHQKWILNITNKINKILKVRR